METNQKVALVTGANRGIGFELVRQLAQQGNKVLLASRNPQKGQQAVQALKKSSLDVAYLHLDVDSLESIQQANDRVSHEYGKLDILINNAGILLDQQGGLLKEDASILEQTLKTNLLGAYYVTKTFLPLMMANDYGRIVNISSTMGKLSVLTSERSGAYKLSKFALNGLTQLLAAEVTGDIRVNAVCPGWVSTDMGGLSASRTPQEAAKKILWLTTLDASGPNGQFFSDGQKISW